MRIISGRLKGRKLPIQKGEDIRPTKDSVKESLFSSIENNLSLKQCNVLDLYAGSGSLGLEALSRGAKKVYFVESNKIRAKLLNSFLKEIKEESNTKVYELSVEKFLKKEHLLLKNSIDLVLIDPPYPTHPGNKIFDYLYNSKYLKDLCKVVIECPSNLEMKERKECSFSEFNLEKKRVYGKTSLFFYIYRRYQEKDER